MADRHTRMKIYRSLSPKACATAAASAGVVVDRAGFETVEFAAHYGAITATNATATLLIKEGDVTGTMTSVANADLDLTESAASIAAGTRTSGVNKNVTKRIRYKGMKRYVSGTISTTVSAIIAGVDVILMDPRVSPTTT